MPKIRTLAALALVALLAACGGGEPSSEAPTPVLRWGGDAEGGAPYVEADPLDPSVMRGFDVEVADQIAKGLGRKAQFVQVAWSSIDQSVERGDYDIGMSGVEDTPARRARHATTIPYFEFREVLAVRPEDSTRYRVLADLAGHRVGTLGATMAYDIVLDAQRRYGVVPVSYDDDVHPYEDLAAGRLDGVLLDHIIAQRSLTRTGGFIIQPEPAAIGHYVGVLAAANTALRDSINQVLKARMADGTLEEIFRRWGVWDPSQARLFQRLVAGVPVDEGPEMSPPAADATRSDSSTGLTPGGPGNAVGTAPVGTAPVGGTRGVSARSVAAFLPTLVRAAGMTILLSVLSMALAVIVGVGVAAGRIYGPWPIRTALTAFVEVMRGTPVLLQLFVIYYGLASFVRLPAFPAAILGLGLNYAAYESEIYRGALQAVSRVQLEAARTLGFGELQILRLIRGPQALRYALAPMTNDFVALLKDSSLVSVITVIELTKQTAIYATNIGSWVVPGILCAAMYLAMSLPLAHLARRLERRWALSS
jgi:His/Glu/Gln/Arg/opine family amino acid ABC transporter permease subunit